MEHKHNTPLTDAEIQFVKENAHVLVDDEMVVALTRLLSRLVTPAQIRLARKQLGIRKLAGKTKIPRIDYERSEGMGD